MTIIIKTYSNHLEKHQHAFQQWVVPLKGELEITVGKVKGIVSKDAAVFIPGNEIHKFYSESDNAFIVLNVDKKN